MSGDGLTVFFGGGLTDIATKISYSRLVGAIEARVSPTFANVAVVNAIQVGAIER